MHSSTTGALGTNADGKTPAIRIVKTTPMERFSWLVMGVIVLVTGVIFLTDQTHPISTVELVLSWVLVLTGIKMTVIATAGRYPLPRMFNFLAPNPPR
jgi:uncharacterized membrane protein HdeD (DUF308 family)